MYWIYFNYVTFSSSRTQGYLCLSRYWCLEVYVHRDLMYWVNKTTQSRYRSAFLYMKPKEIPAQWRRRPETRQWRRRLETPPVKRKAGNPPVKRTAHHGKSIRGTPPAFNSLRTTCGQYRPPQLRQRRIVGSGEVYGCDKHPSFKQVAVGILTHKGHLALTINYMQTEKTFFVTFQLRIVPVQRQTSLHPWAIKRGRRQFLFFTLARKTTANEF